MPRSAGGGGAAAAKGASVSTADAPPSSVQPRKQRVIVIGAGVAGLAAAKELVAASFDVTVLEVCDVPDHTVHVLFHLVAAKCRCRSGGCM